LLDSLLQEISLLWAVLELGFAFHPPCKNQSIERKNKGCLEAADCRTTDTNLAHSLGNKSCIKNG